MSYKFKKMLCFTIAFYQSKHLLYIYYNIELIIISFLRTNNKINSVNRNNEINKPITEKPLKPYCKGNKENRKVNIDKYIITLNIIVFSLNKNIAVNIISKTVIIPVKRGPKFA